MQVGQGHQPSPHVKRCSFLSGTAAGPVLGFSEGGVGVGWAGTQDPCQLHGTEQQGAVLWPLQEEVEMPGCGSHPEGETVGAWCGHCTPNEEKGDDRGT